jgi:hypothetical protein
VYRAFLGVCTVAHTHQCPTKEIIARSSSCCIVECKKHSMQESFVLQAPLSAAKDHLLAALPCGCYGTVKEARARVLN